MSITSSPTQCHSKYTCQNEKSIKRETNNSSKNSTLDGASYFENRVKIAASVLEEIISENKKNRNYYINLKNQRDSLFNINKASASLSTEAYISRVADLLDFSESELIYMLVLIDRITVKSNIMLTEKNIHKLILVSSYLTEKMLRDCICQQKYYEAVYGIPICDINKIESYCLQMLDYEAHVSYSRYLDYKCFFDQCDL